VDLSIIHQTKKHSKAALEYIPNYHAAHHLVLMRIECLLRKAMDDKMNGVVYIWVGSTTFDVKARHDA
jgi:hypothetical protein